MEVFRCAICRATYPTSLKHVHHKIPQSLGGTDEPSNLADLCHSDHNNLHLIAYMILNVKRRHEIEPTVMSIYPGNIEARKSLLEYAALVAREMQLKKETKKPEDEEIKIMVEIPGLYRELLKLLGYDRPRPNGKPRGLSSLVRLLIAEALILKFPLMRDKIKRLQNP